MEQGGPRDQQFLQHVFSFRFDLVTLFSTYIYLLSHTYSTWSVRYLSRLRSGSEKGQVWPGPVLPPGVLPRVREVTGVSALASY